LYWASHSPDTLKLIAQQSQYYWAGCWNHVAVPRCTPVAMLTTTQLPHISLKGWRCCWHI